MGRKKPQNEAELWLQVSDNLKPYGHFSRVESPDTSAGIPDVDFCIDGVESHMELKFCVTKNGRIKSNLVRPSQAIWFRKRIKNKGHPWLLALFLAGETQYYLLLDNVEDVYESQDLDFWKSQSVRVWRNNIGWDELVSIILSCS